MEGKNIYSYMPLMNPCNFSHVVNIPDDSRSGLGKARFYKAFVTQGRAEGTCRLALIWQRGITKNKLEVHYYQLNFNHEGIKNYEVEDISRLGFRGWYNRLDYAVIPIGLAEAASLVQDAYEQNKRFQTKTPLGISDAHLLFEFDTEAVERFKLCYGLFPPKLDILMFTNIYLAALKRLDRGLLYDLAHPERQRRLGERLEYLREGEDSLSQCTFLRTCIEGVETQGLQHWVQAYAVLSTPQDELVKIRYQIQALGEKGQYYLLDFTEVEREKLPPAHPNNPLNYQVFATRYRHNDKFELERWLIEQPSIFLGGELASGDVYKWLNGGSCPWEEFDFSRAISAEFYVTDHELLVFSQSPEKLAGISRLLAEDLRGTILIQEQYYLPISQLYTRILATQEWQNSPGLANQLKEYRAASYILLLEPWEKERFTAYIRKMVKKTVRLGHGASYYFIQNGKFLAELYSVGRWIKLRVYCGDGAEELTSFKSRFHLTDIIKDTELENHFDLFTPPLSQHRKWVIFRQLLLLSKEAALIKDMGLVPSVRDAAKQLGVVI